MPFPLGHVCDLLDGLERLEAKGLSPRTRNAAYAPLIRDWFAYFRADLTADTWLSLFSALFPDLRCDRRYGIREDGLLKLVSKSLCLGSTRQKNLEQWKEKAHGDLGVMVEQTMQQAENTTASIQSITIEEIHSSLDQLASFCKFSEDEIHASRIRQQQQEITQNDTEQSGKRLAVLQPLFKQITSQEAKWLVRMILRSLLPVELSHNQTFGIFHFMLPDIYAMQSNLSQSLAVLNTPSFRLFPSRPRPEEFLELRTSGRQLLRPQIGVKLGRLEFVKAKSCAHAVQLAGRRRMALDRKYDGEYCQIHIDLTKGADWLKIFSKSGRNSTDDRSEAHDIIRQCVRLDFPEQRAFKNFCVLECEFLVYSTRETRIMEFCHIKNHVTRSGVFLGSSSNATRPMNTAEHVLLKFFDCLVLDDKCSPASSFGTRRHHLENVVREIPTKAELTKPTILDFGVSTTSQELETLFARGIALRWEGFVLKPCEGTYFNTDAENAWIKLKKDYIKGCGDCGDFAIVGGAYHHVRGRERRLMSDTPTVFHVGCLKNRREVVLKLAKPVFQIVFTVSYCLTKQDLAQLKIEAKFNSLPFKVCLQQLRIESTGFDIAKTSQDSGLAASPFHLLPRRKSVVAMDFTFLKPPVFEIFGGGFDKDEEGRFWVLRWPRVSKVHLDRDVMEAVDFNGLQEMARVALQPPEDVVAEERHWVSKLAVASSNSPLSTMAKTMGMGSLSRVPITRFLESQEGHDPSVKDYLRKLRYQVTSIKDKGTKRNLLRMLEGLGANGVKVACAVPSSAQSPVRMINDTSSKILQESFTRGNINASQDAKQHRRFPPLQRDLNATPAPRKRQKTSAACPSSPPCSPKSLIAREAVRSSPLSNHDVYLMEYLLTKPATCDLLSELGIVIAGSCSDILASAAEVGITNMLGPKVLLVEDRKRSELQTLLRKLYSGKGQVKVEVYSCRMLSKIEEIPRSGNRRKMKKVDWTLWHIDSI